MKALAELTACTFDPLELTLVLDALGDGLQLEDLGEIHHRGCQFGDLVARVRQERPVDLQNVDREAAQVVQR